MTQRTFLVERRYLNLPVRNGAAKRTLRFVVEGEEVYRFDIELAEGEPDFWVYADLTPFQNSQLTVTADGGPADGLAALVQSDTPLGMDDLYREKYRPQFHFSSRRGWLNDPNGLVYYGGVYHLFYQHNPYGWSWGNMHWGHAVSSDLLHWEELGDTFYPDHLGVMFSGCAVVDRQNTTGFQDGDDPPLVCIYTAAGNPFTQCLAYSTDGGVTWVKYAGNPVLDHIVGENRDPKVIWHAPSQQWVMALYLVDNDYALFGSPDLKTWRKLCDVHIGDAIECPDFFELPVDDDPANTRWVFWGANGNYVLGRFDGETFTPESEVLHYARGGDSYAAQTWSDTPDGRRIQIAWLRVNLPGMPFNQMMTFPCELALWTTPEGIRLCSWPVPEIESLYDWGVHWADETLAPGEVLQDDIIGWGNRFDIYAEVDPGAATTLNFVLRGVPVTYDVTQETLTCAGRTVSMPLVGGMFLLRILLDLASLEIFGADGLVALPLGLIPPDEDLTLRFYVEGGPTGEFRVGMHTLLSVWAGDEEAVGEWIDDGTFPF
ncbi:MAG TPA: 2,6-beta-D-fructofuranosidase [Anaerolineae bacterium]|nr:2,6-beta-D-fructofuranosidase [Anaerolineae bacterium]HQK12758.1 2,6-beta-D-fructofuranosidase [Anaerolineae bacterium]